MKTKQPTKEELVVELERASRDINGRIADDLTRRKEFARAFGWNKARVAYDNEVKLYEPTWIEIFVEVGKLLMKEDFRDFEREVQDTTFKVQAIERALEKDKVTPLT